jgi:uncharacterized protein (DUF983 family)
MSRLGDYLHKYAVGGLRLRCPNCERGRLFKSGFTLNETCPECGVRFERRSGESIGGVMINLVIVEFVAIGGFLLVTLLTTIRPIDQLIFWIPFGIILPVVFYRNSRGLWVTTSYLNGDVRADEG